MDDDCRRHSRSELLTDGERIARLERQVASLRDDVLKLKAVVGEFDGNLDATDYTLGMGIHDLRRTVDYMGERLNALEDSDKQTVRHGMDNDTDIADLGRRVKALEGIWHPQRFTTLEARRQAAMLTDVAQDGDDEASNDLETLARYNQDAYRNEIAWLSNPE